MPRSEPTKMVSSSSGWSASALTGISGSPSLMLVHVSPRSVDLKT
jgi:hypothetical protein